MLNFHAEPGPILTGSQAMLKFSITKWPTSWPKEVQREGHPTAPPPSAKFAKSVESVAPNRAIDRTTPPPLLDQSLDLELELADDLDSTGSEPDPQALPPIPPQPPSRPLRSPPPPGPTGPGPAPPSQRVRQKRKRKPIGRNSRRSKARRRLHQGARECWNESSDEIEQDTDTSTHQPNHRNNNEHPRSAPSLSTDTAPPQTQASASSPTTDTTRVERLGQTDRDGLIEIDGKSRRQRLNQRPRHRHGGPEKD